MKQRPFRLIVGVVLLVLQSAVFLIIFDNFSFYFHILVWERGHCFYETDQEEEEEGVISLVWEGERDQTTDKGGDQTSCQF